VAGHTHDGIDWTTWLHRLREADAVVAGGAVHWLGGS
jgi:hypothetical protein